MSDNFVPSPSIDSQSMPMDVNSNIPLLTNVSCKEEYSISNGHPPTITNMQRPSLVTKNYFDYDTSTSRCLTKWPSAGIKMFETSNLPCLMQITRASFYQALLSEFIGTFLLTLICTSTGLPVTSKPVPDLHGALVCGFVVATMVVGLGHVSGAHINPAVTISFLVACEIDMMRALCYICFQLLGAICASRLLSSLLPPHVGGNLGMTTITEGVTIQQAFIIEFIITFILCFTVHAICDKRRNDIGGSKALAVGLAVTVGALFGGPYTGASMNPARSLGPATVMNTWENQWLYWFAPLTGSIVAALMYTRILKQCTPPIATQFDPTSYTAIDKMAQV